MTTVTNAPVTPTLTMTALRRRPERVSRSRRRRLPGCSAGSSGATTGCDHLLRDRSRPPRPRRTCPTGHDNRRDGIADGRRNVEPERGLHPARATTLWWYAKFAGDAGDNPASSACGPLTGMASTTVKTGQTIYVHLDAHRRAAHGERRRPTTATATASLRASPVTFSSATPSVCTASGAVFTFIAEGTCTVNANQAGNGTYNPAPQVQQSVHRLQPDADEPDDRERQRHVAQGGRQRHDHRSSSTTRFSRAASARPGRSCRRRSPASP